MTRFKTTPQAIKNGVVKETKYGIILGPSYSHRNCTRVLLDGMKTLKVMHNSFIEKLPEETKMNTNLETGMVIDVKNLNTLMGDDKRRLEFGYKVKRGERFMVLYLGKHKVGEEVDIKKVLDDIGLQFKPDHPAYNIPLRYLDGEIILEEMTK